MKLTILAGIFIPATVTSSIFGQNIAGSPGFPLRVVAGTTIAVFTLGGALTARSRHQKNSGKHHKSILAKLCIAE